MPTSGKYTIGRGEISGRGEGKINKKKNERV
jgi:hypothetical protein